MWSLHISQLFLKKFKICSTQETMSPTLQGEYEHSGLVKVSYCMPQTRFAICPSEFKIFFNEIFDSTHVLPYAFGA